MTDVVMFAGNSHKIRITVTDNNTSNPLNLTGCTIKFKVSKKPKDASPLFEKTLGSGVTVIGPMADGVFEAVIAPADTLGKSGDFYHEADVKEPGGRLTTVSTGKLTVIGTLVREADIA